MKFRTLVLLGLVATAFSFGCAEEIAMSKIIRDDFDFAAAQYTGMLERLKPEQGSPRTFEKGKLVLASPRDWTSGFFPGSLWYLFEVTGDVQWKEPAAKYTAALESAKNNRGTHDLGFVLYCSFGNGLRLTGDAHYREVLLTGAESLSSRFNPKVGCIKSWDRGEWKYPVIIDNMMNLELLSWASWASSTPQYRDIAVSHADTTLKNHFRSDHSSYHVVGYNPETGAVEVKQTHQGTADDSAWARGQAWACMATR